MQLSELRKELKFNRELVQLIETLKNIAAAQYHLMEKEKERFDRFMGAFAGFFRVVNLVETANPLVRSASDTLGLVVITSDSGFMGGLNQGVIRAALAAQGETPDEKTALVVVGEKGQTAFADMGRAFRFFPGISQETIYEQAVEIKDHIVEEVLAGRMGRVLLAYPKPLSFSAQDIDVIRVLPCGDLISVEDEPGEGAQASTTLRGFMQESLGVIVESSFADMAQYLASTWVTSKLYEVFEDSKLAEFSARAMHLEGSFKKLEEQLKKVRHQTFKASHEKIDKGMRESFGAKKGMKRRRRGATQPQAAADA